MANVLLAPGYPSNVQALLKKLNAHFKNRIVWDHKEHDNDI